MQPRIPCMILRGGTSNGVWFLADDLPHAPERRDALLPSIIGSPDLRQIDGIAGAHPLTSKIASTAAPIRVEFLDLAGSVCGSLLPTGSAVDRVAGVDVTMIDNGMPVAALEAASVGRIGYKSRDLLDKDIELKTRLEKIRLETGRFIGLSDVLSKVVPKMALMPPAADAACLRPQLSPLRMQCVDRRLCDCHGRHRLRAGRLARNSYGADPAGTQEDLFGRASDWRVQLDDRSVRIA